ncbi:MAG: hypothetical protein JWR10_1277 [Rubritepida sp.]|nr:hypothetical protein [Rubritepida sp.]
MFFVTSAMLFTGFGFVPGFIVFRRSGESPGHGRKHALALGLTNDQAGAAGIALLRRVQCCRGRCRTKECGDLVNALPDRIERRLFRRFLCTGNVSE